MTSDFSPGIPRHSSPQCQSSEAAGLSIDRADIAAMALLVGGLLALFGKVIFTPAMFFYRDVFNYSYPHARLIHETCRQGYLPYWNPYWNYGEPLLANPNFLFFYPDTLFLVLLPTNLAYTLHYVVHFALAGVGTYWLARRWGQSRAGAFFAASVFEMSGPLLSLGNLYNHAACAAWIPWALLLTDRAVESRSRRSWILLALVFALQFLASEPLTLLATFGLSAAYAFYRAGTTLHPLAASNRRILAGFILVGCLMVMLSAVQFLPSLDLLRHSLRGTEGLVYNETTSWSFHPLALLEMAIPDLFGASLEAPSTWTIVLSGRLMPYFPSVFVGFVPLFFALAGWALGNDRRRAFVAKTAFTLLLLSFGRFTPAFALAYLLIPLLALVRFPVKLLVPAVLLTALLAGWGLDALRLVRGRLTERRGRILLPLKYLLACTVLVWIASLLASRWIEGPAAWVLLRTNEMFARHPAGELDAVQVAGATSFFLSKLRVVLPGLVGFLLGSIVWLLALEQGKVWARRALPGVALLGLAQMVWVNSQANPTVPTTFYTYRPPVLAHFQASALPYRFSYIAPEPDSPPGSLDVQEFINLDSIPEAAGFSPLAQAAFRDKLLLARGSMLTEVEGTFNADVERSAPPSLYEFWRFAVYSVPEASRVDCLLGRTNVRYQIRRVRHATATTREVAPIFNGSPQPSYLYENLCVVPRVFVANSARFSTSAQETLARLSSPDFEAQREVLLAAEPQGPPDASGSGDAGRVEIVARQPNAIVLHCELDRPGYVVLLDRFDPNWHATLDSHDVPILRANLLFRAVHAAAGRHEIRFYYHQSGLRAGLLISLSTLIALGMVYALEPHRPESHLPA